MIQHPPHAGALRAARLAKALAVVALVAALVVPSLARSLDPRLAVAASFFPRQLVSLDLPALRLPWPVPASDLEKVATDPWGHPFLLGPRRGGRSWEPGPGERASAPWACKVYSCGPDGRDDLGEGDDLLLPALLARPHGVELFGVSLDASRSLGPALDGPWRAALLAGARPALVGLGLGLVWLAGSLWLAARPRRRGRREWLIVPVIASGPVLLGVGPVVLASRSLDASWSALFVDTAWAAAGSWTVACLVLAVAWRLGLPGPDEEQDARPRRRRVALGATSALLLVGVTIAADAWRRTWVMGRTVERWEDTLLAGSSEERLLAGLVLAQAGADVAPLASALEAAYLRANLTGDMELTNALAAAYGRTGPEAVAALTSLASGPGYVSGAARGLAATGADAAPAVPALLDRVRRRGWFVDELIVLTSVGPLPAEAAPLLRRALGARGLPDPERFQLLCALAAVEPAAAAEGLVACAESAQRTDHTDQLALEELARLGPAARGAARGLLARGLAWSHPHLRALALLALQGQAFDRDVLARALASTDAEVRAAGLFVVGALDEPGPAALAAARAALGDGNVAVRGQAALALGVHGDARDRAALEAALERRDDVVRAILRVALSRMR